MSTGDSAYPVVSFNNRVVKEFEPKVSIKTINNKQRELINYISKVPRHTKLIYQSPMVIKLNIVFIAHGRLFSFYQINL